MKVRGFLPQLKTLESLIMGSIQMKNIEEARHFFSEIKVNSMVPSSEIYLCIIESLVKLREIRKTFERIKIFPIKNEKRGRRA